MNPKLNYKIQGPAGRWGPVTGFDLLSKTGARLALGTRAAPAFCGPLRSKLTPAAVLLPASLQTGNAYAARKNNPGDWQAQAYTDEAAHLQQPAPVAASGGAA